MKRTTLKRKTGCEALSNLCVAETFAERLKGLLGREAIGPDEGMLLPDCRAVHTFFMRCALDVVFLSEDLRVTEVVSRVGPGRMLRSAAPDTRHTLEIGEGRAHELAIAIGEDFVVGNA